MLTGSIYTLLGARCAHGSAGTACGDPIGPGRQVGAIGGAGICRLGAGRGGAGSEGDREHSRREAAAGGAVCPCQGAPTLRAGGLGQDECGGSCKAATSPHAGRGKGDGKVAQGVAEIIHIISRDGDKDLFNGYPFNPQALVVRISRRERGREMFAML